MTGLSDPGKVGYAQGMQMALTTTQPNVPIFVSSTFTDMQPYRRKVRDALAQLEAVVRGMEQFGSKPGSPVEECLAVVRSCRLYVGLFGMRYGSVPDGYEKSMTHLEYDEAQIQKLPSLIYILEETQPIPAKDVETGDGAEKLKLLKDQLKKRHTVSFYTTPEDLQSRILHDLRTQLDQMGVEVADGIGTAEEISDIELLKKFQILPKIFSGRQVTVEFPITDVRAAFGEDCTALGLEIGATVTFRTTLSSGQSLFIYGEREIALNLLALPKGTVIKARANTAFGTAVSVLWAEDEPIPDWRAETGLIVTQILVAEPAESIE